MAGEFTPWKTSDYFDPWPGVQAGLARRRQNESEFQFRQLQKQHALDKAAEDKYHSEQMAMEAGQLSARFGVQPVMGADGRFDPVGTARAGVLKEATDEAAIGLAQKHAAMADMTGTDEFFPTEEEQKLMQEPLYRQARGEAEFKFRLERVKDEAIRNRMIQKQVHPPSLVDVGGVKLIQNQETGALIRVPDRGDGTAKKVYDEDGRLVGHKVGEQMITYHPTAFESVIGANNKPTGTNAPPTVPTGPGGKVIRYDKTGQRLN